MATSDKDPTPPPSSQSDPQPHSDPPPYQFSDLEKLKIAAILHACCTRNRLALVDCAIADGGLLSDEARKEACEPCPQPTHSRLLQWLIYRILPCAVQGPYSWVATSCISVPLSAILGVTSVHGWIQGRSY